jgi:hypothetical protein
LTRDDHSADDHSADDHSANGRNFDDHSADDHSADDHSADGASFDDDHSAAPATGTTIPTTSATPVASTIRTRFDGLFSEFPIFHPLAHLHGHPCPCA